jgi:hypothetical protein
VPIPFAVAADRLRPVVLGRSKPRDRSEEDLVGYRRTLDWVFTRKRMVTITVLTENVIRRGWGESQAG